MPTAGNLWACPCIILFLWGPGPTSDTVLRVPRVHKTNENGGCLLWGTRECEYFTPKDIEWCTSIGVNLSETSFIYMQFQFLQILGNSYEVTVCQLHIDLCIAMHTGANTHVFSLVVI